MNQQAYIAAIATYLPERIVDNEELAANLEGWTAAMIYEKTGVRTRHWSAENELASDMAVKAAERLFAAGHAAPDDVDMLVCCTQSPDYLLPTTACLLQDRLHLGTNCLAFDINLGCSGFVYALAVVKSLLETHMGKRALLITTETYSKFLKPGDRNATLFGDAAAASLIELTSQTKDREQIIGPFVFGTDGSGAANLIVPGSACRPSTDGMGPDGALFMNGPKIFAFSLERVPQAVDALLKRAGLTLDNVDLVVMHQANAFMLENLRRKLEIPPEKMTVVLEETGNTVPSSIPLALEAEQQRGRLGPGTLVMLVGFGVGYSWAACLVRWR